MNRKPKPQTSWIGLLLVAVCASVLGYWTISNAQQIDQNYATTSHQAMTTPSVALSLEGGRSSINIPDWSWFKPGQIWEYMSPSTPRKSTVEGALIQSPVEISSDSDARIDSRIKPSLLAMFEAASDDGVDLMLSSAYRSRDSQQNLYDLYLTIRGRAWVDNYVALPGHSEHETGLVVDISTADPGCRKDSNACTLQPNAIAWLEDNAGRFGFIQRYPSGKQSITGVASEAWHYRYVGTELAKFLKTEDVTFDEFVRDAAPGYAKQVSL